jgi:single-stranded-DNA-specific exonuclease
MELAVDRVKSAIAGSEVMAVYGDFDADGITATALLVETINALGGHSIPYIPHRAEEGYGLNTGALNELQKHGVRLVITVDCGTTAHREVAEGQALGLDIIVTDHHSPANVLPDSMAMINPKLPRSKYPFLDLSGAGVAFKLAQGLLAEHRMRGQINEDPLFELVALGTVTDMSPLQGENRFLVKRGLAALNRSERPGLRELMRLAGLSPGSVDSEAVGYVLGPRLNAVGRIDHALVGYQVLVTSSNQEAANLAEHLETSNTERRERTRRAMDQAMSEVAAGDVESPLYFVKTRDYGVGIIGLVAGRLCEEFYRPVVVAEVAEEESRGSVRSIPEFNAMTALEMCSDILIRFGGHAQAAGFTVANANLPELEARLTKLATQQLDGLELKPVLDIDAEIAPHVLAAGGIDLIGQLEPFGRGNPVPTFLSRGMEVVEAKTVGRGGEHLRVKLREGPDHSGAVWNGIGFGLGSLKIKPRTKLDVVYSLGIDNYHGYNALELKIQDAVASSSLS